MPYLGNELLIQNGSSKYHAGSAPECHVPNQGPQHSTLRMAYSVADIISSGRRKTFGGTPSPIVDIGLIALSCTFGHFPSLLVLSVTLKVIGVFPDGPL